MDIRAGVAHGVGIRELSRVDRLVDFTAASTVHLDTAEASTEQAFMVTDSMERRRSTVAVFTEVVVFTEAVAFTEADAANGSSF